MENISREEVKNSLTEIFRNVFDNDAITLHDEMTAKDVKRWDSLNHINLIVATEQKFKVKFITAEVIRLKNVGGFIDMILQKLAAKK